MADTSIGGINAAIIAGTHYIDDATKKLEEFWIELSVRFLPVFPTTGHNRKSSFDNMFENLLYSLPKNSVFPNYYGLWREQQTKGNQSSSFISSAILGNSKFFVPR